MPDPAGTHADGSIAFGTQASQFGGAPPTFVFEKISTKRGQRRIQQNNIYGVPAKKIHVTTLLEGSATLQYPDATTPSPAQFAVFPLTPAGGGAAINFILEEIGEEFEHEGETKCNITFAIKLN